MVDNTVNGWVATLNSEAEQVEDLDNWEYVPPSPINGTTLPIAFSLTAEPCGTERSEMRDAFALYTAAVIGSTLILFGMAAAPPVALVAAGTILTEAAAVSAAHANLNTKKAAWSTCFNNNSAYYRRRNN